MDYAAYINDFRALFTVLSFAVFIAIVIWAWSSRRSESFAQAARMALDDDAPVQGGSTDLLRNSPN